MISGWADGGVSSWFSVGFKLRCELETVCLRMRLGGCYYIRKGDEDCHGLL
jgi:hypothetical protein